MTARSLFAGTLVASVLSISSTGCSGSAGDSTSSATRSAPSTAVTEGSTRAGPTTTTMTSATTGATVAEPRDPTGSDPTNFGTTTSDAWPTDLALPDGMEIVGEPERVGGEMSATLTCRGPGSTALTDLTEMFNTAGYHTNWKLGTTNDVGEPVVLEATAKDRSLRAAIYEDAYGSCTKVVIASMH